MTLNTLFHGAWALLLSRYSGESDVVFGSTISVRTKPDLAGMDSTVDLFSAPLPLRVSIPPDAPLISWLERLQSQQREQAGYTYAPLPKIQEWSDLPEGAHLFESIVIFENYPIHALGDGEHNRPLDINSSKHIDRTPYALTLTVSLHQDLSILISYDANRFGIETIKRMAGHFQTLLAGMAASPDQRLSDLPLLTSIEQRQLLVEWNNTQVAYPQDQGIHQRFEAQVQRTPLAFAVVFERQQLTYRELNHRANQLARHLQTMGVSSETLVGVCLERSLEMLISLLAILKAGGAYVPLDPAYPPERLSFMVEDSQLKVLVSHSALQGVLPHPQAQVVRLDTDAAEIAAQPTDNLDIPVAPDHLAYVIYTSGSTGNPKGVMIEHQSLTNFLSSMREAPGLTAADTLLAVTTISFDIAALELYLPLLTGAKIVLVSREVAIDAVQLWSEIQRSGATVMQATPATWRSLLTTGWPDDYTLKILCGGEALPPDLAESLLATGSSLWNMYGPTETTIWSATKRLDSANPPISIGRPLANTQFYVLDLQLKPVPIGVTGELYIGGDGLARGYLNRPELTAEKFIVNPFVEDRRQKTEDRSKVRSQKSVPSPPSPLSSPSPPSPPSSPASHSRLYKTGDLARYLPNGELEILGRIDHQVKIRGFRIELGEIEAALAQHRSVQEGVVTVREEVPGDKRLAAYVVLNPDQSLTLEELRRFLMAHLPDYMIPGGLMLLEALPHTPNGKIDRRALPAPDWSSFIHADTFVAPRTLVEEQLAEIWAEVLRLEKVGIHDNFFELGGHSLLATQIMSRTNQAFLSVEVPLRTLFELPTIAALADRIETIRWVTNAADESADDDEIDYMEGAL